MALERVGAKLCVKWPPRALKHRVPHLSLQHGGVELTIFELIVIRPYIGNGTGTTSTDEQPKQWGDGNSPRWELDLGLSCEITEVVVWCMHSWQIRKV